LKDIARRENLSRTTLGHIKHFLSGAFRYPRRQGVLENVNPMHDVEIPKARPAGETYAYSLEEEAQMLAILPEPTATVVARLLSPARARERSEVSLGRTTTAPKFELKNPSGEAMWTNRSARRARAPFRSSLN